MEVSTENSRNVSEKPVENTNGEGNGETENDAAAAEKSAPPPVNNNAINGAANENLPDTPIVTEVATIKEPW